jgi:hypothetical protein
LSSSRPLIAPPNPKLIVFHLVARLSFISFRVVSGDVWHLIYGKAESVANVCAYLWRRKQSQTGNVTHRQRLRKWKWVLHVYIKQTS